MSDSNGGISPASKSAENRVVPRNPDPPDSATNRPDRVPGDFVIEGRPRVEPLPKPTAELETDSSLNERTLDELYQIARYLKIDGRSVMTREALLNHIRESLKSPPKDKCGDATSNASAKHRKQ